MDFKIGEELDENGQNSYQSILPIIIVIVVAIICGLVVFGISYLIFKPKEQPEPEPLKSISLNLNEENVQILYQYIISGPRGVRNDKCLRGMKVSLENFTDQEKYNYALQFAQAEDFEATGEVNNKGKKIYNFSNDKLEEYMVRYFGPAVTYNKNLLITYPFSFRINNENVGFMTYSSPTDSFETIFEGLEEDVQDTALVKPYYSELVAAYKEPDGSYRLEEKVIYTDHQVQGDSYNINIYKDYNHTGFIETKNLTEEMLKNNPIDVKAYKEKTGTVSYLFKTYNTMLYFDSCTPIA